MTMIYSFFSVSPTAENKWEQLFRKIEQAYKCRDSYADTRKIETYLSTLNQMTDKDSVAVKATWQSNKSAVWRSKFLVFLHYSDNLQMLLEQTKEYDWFYETYKESLVLLCHKFMHILQTEYCEIKFDGLKKDSREYRLVKAFESVYNYFKLYGDSSVFVSMCLDK